MGRIVFAVITAGLVTYLVVVGLDRADKVGSSISAVFALLALAAPYLLPTVSPAPVEDRAERTGPARASDGGRAVTGLEMPGGDRSAQAIDTGPATASGPGSVAVTGIHHQR